MEELQAHVKTFKRLFDNPQTEVVSFNRTKDNYKLLALGYFYGAKLDEVYASYEFLDALIAVGVKL